MANRSRADVERELEQSAVAVVQLQKDTYELEQQREGPEPPADLDEQIRRKTDELKAAQERWTVLKAEADTSV
jgi:hypothetical protein